MNEEKYIKPVHPGEILYEEFLQPLGISQNKIAKEIGVPPRRINEIVHGKRGITADTAMRLERYFGASAEFWLNLQVQYELDNIKYIERTSKNKKFNFIKAYVPKIAAML